MVNLEALKRFLVEAHTKKYTSDKNKSPSPSRFGSTEFRHRNSGFDYVDSYYGNRRFIGEEIVCTGILMSEAAWGMNYYGHILDDGFKSDVVYGFLKKALLVGANKDNPLRGPDHWTEEAFSYGCEIDNLILVDNDLEEFRGVERIYFKEEMIYEAVFHGGLIEL